MIKEYTPNKEAFLSSLFAYFRTGVVCVRVGVLFIVLFFLYGTLRNDDRKTFGFHLVFSSI
jgi:hypothetical protein